MRRLIKHSRRVADAIRELYATSHFYRVTSLLSAAFVIVMVALPLWRLYPTGEEDNFIALHYNVYLGVDQFGPWYFIFSIPLLGATLFLLNLTFEIFFFRREHVLSKFFAVATVCAEAILFVATVLIVLLNM